MEACGSAYFWGREIGNLGHEVRPLPPPYVKPLVKRQQLRYASDCALGSIGVVVMHADLNSQVDQEGVRVTDGERRR